MTDEQGSAAHAQLLKQLAWTRLLAVGGILLGAWGLFERMHERRIEAKYVQLTSLLKKDEGQCVLAGSGEGLTLVFTDENSHDFKLGVALNVKDRQVIVRDEKGAELRRFNLAAD